MSLAPVAFYEPGAHPGDFLATELTRGPWDPGTQHAGPPAALLGRAVAGLPDGADYHLSRLTFEILRPIPIAPVTVRAEIVRPGRRVQLASAELAVGGEVLMRAAGWRLRTESLTMPAAAVAIAAPPPGPDRAEPVEFFPTGHELGYHSAMELRFVAGGFVELGPAIAWLRMRSPLVAGEEPAPLERALIAADVGNGISSVLDFRCFTFVNVDLTVQLERLPAGEWVCVDAVTLPRPSGVATAESVLSDEEGRIGRALQSLLVSPR